MRHHPILSVVVHLLAVGGMIATVPSLAAQTVGDGRTGTTVPRIRPPTPPRTETPAPEETRQPRRVQIGKPDIGIDRPPLPPTAIRTVDTVQADCLYRDDATAKLSKQASSGTSAVAEGSGTALLEMVCRTAGGGEQLMTFRYDAGPQAAPRVQARNDFDAGYASRVSFEVKSSEAGVSGRPVYRLTGISRGERSRKTLDCVNADYALKAVPNGNDGPAVRKWCSDGKTITLVDFRTNGWLARNSGGKITLSEGSAAAPAEYITSVDYETATSGSPYLVTAVRHKPAPAGPPPDCTLNSRDLGSLYCDSKPVLNNKGGLVQTSYLAFSPAEIRARIGPMAKDECSTRSLPVYDSFSGGGNIVSPKGIRYYDYKVTDCTSNRPAYHLLPGIVASEHRSAAMGACYVASGANIVETKTRKETYARAIRIHRDEAGNIWEGDAVGKGVGVETPVQKVNAPCS